MAFELEKGAARRMVASIEDGRLSVSATLRLFEGADPALVHFILAWLRAWYPPSHPAAEGVLGRLGTLLEKYPQVARLAREGRGDPIVAWFEDAYGYRDFRADAFVDLIVEKLEG